MKKLKYSLFLVGLCLSLAGCGQDRANVKTDTDTQLTRTQESETIETISEDSKVTKDVFAMDTYMTLTAYGENANQAVEEAAAEIQDIEALVSTNIDTSEVSIINKNGKGTVSEDTADLIKRSIEIYQDTEGAFDITIYPVLKAWGFTTGEYQVPGDKELTSLLKLVGSDYLILDKDNNEVSLKKNGMEIDLGGITKGYTSAKIMDIFKSYGIKSGVVSLGGNVQTLGSKFNGEAWKVAIESPDESSEYLGTVSVTDKAVITSGGYERYFEKDGQTYHHIINPDTGYPANEGLTSVTIISSDGTLADGLSTSLFVMGKAKAIAYWQKNSETFDAILVEDNGNILVTEGIIQNFSSEKEYEIIQKG